MNIVCSGAGEWPQILRKREGRVFFDELEPYSLGSQPARPGQAELRPCLVLYRGEGGALTAAQEDLMFLIGQLRAMPGCYNRQLSHL